MTEQVAAEIAADRPDDVRRLVAGYLRQVQGTIRATMKRPSDRTGRTLAPRCSLRSADDLVPLLPASLPRFNPGDRPAGLDRELIRCLGIGGFSEVWLARNPHFSSRPPVALKFARDAVSADLIRNEVALLERLEAKSAELHPGIVRLLETHLELDPPCLEYEYVDGLDLAGLIRHWNDEGNESGLDHRRAAGVSLQIWLEIVGTTHILDSSDRSP